jgi:hypothetical protein
MRSFKKLQMGREEKWEKVNRLHEEETYGYRRVWAVIRFDRGVMVNRKKVQRIMQVKRWQAKPIKRPSRSKEEPYQKRYEVADLNKPQTSIESALHQLQEDVTQLDKEMEKWKYDFLEVDDSRFC